MEFHICLDILGDQQLGEPGHFVDGDVARGRDDCKPGAMCVVASEYGAECDPDRPHGCCSRWCDVTTNERTCLGAQQRCVPFFSERETLWPGTEAIGLCTVPA